MGFKVSHLQFILKCFRSLKEVRFLTFFKDSQSVAKTLGLFFNMNNVKNFLAKSKVAKSDIGLLIRRS